MNHLHSQLLRSWADIERRHRRARAIRIAGVVVLVGLSILMWVVLEVTP